MAQERPTTPERELLNLIEDPRKREDSEVQIRNKRVSHEKRSIFSFGAWRGRLSFFKKKINKNAKKRRKEFDLKLVNRALTLIVLGLSAYFAFSLYASFKSLDVSNNLSYDSEVVDESIDEPVTSALKNSASFYLENVRRRNIFDMYKANALKSAVPEVVKVTNSALEKMAENVELVGISWSNDPIAMIEDKRALRTLFLRKGETIGDLKIVAIFKDKVVLSYGGEEIEIR